MAMDLEAAMAAMMGDDPNSPASPIAPLDSFPPDAGGRTFRPLDEYEVRSALGREILDAHGAITAGSQVAEERRLALKMYFGHPMGNEVEGRSQVVMKEVADTIHWIMPSLMRKFKGRDVFEFEPTNPSEEAAAKQATEFINHVFWEELGGYDLLYDWFFTTLLEKNGFVGVEWEERIEPKRETYHGLTENELNMLLSDGRGLEVVEFDERDAILMGQRTVVFDVTVVQTERIGKIRAKAIPPEEFLIARRTIKLDDEATFVGERRKVTAGDLIAMGFDPKEVEQWPTEESPEYSQGRTIRLSEEETFPIRTADRPDAASRELWINNCYMRIDEDGDGYAELRHLMAIGDTAMVLIHDDYADFPPYASLTASPVAHKFFGQSIVDLIGDLQTIRTTLMRQILDNLYLQNNGRMLAVRDEVELDDLLTSRPGGIVRVDNPEAVQPLITPPLPPHAMHMMDFLDGVRETRVGVSKFQQGLDTAGSGSAQGVHQMAAASQQRIELIGDIFAETGMKRLGQLLLRTYKQNDVKNRVVRMRGQWVDVDPSMWNEKFNCKINVGLGVGSAAEMVGYLMATIQIQKDAVQSGGKFMVKPRDIYRATEELGKAMGFDEPFFTDPGQMEWPEEQPDYRILENQRRVEDDKQKNQISAMEAMIEDESRKDMNRYRAEEIKLKQWQATLDARTRIEVAKMQLDAAQSKSQPAQSGEPRDK